MAQITKAQQLLAFIKELLNTNNLTELAFGDPDEQNEPVYVVWYDRHCVPYDDPVLKVFLDGDGLSLEVDACDFGNTVRLYEDDFAHEVNWLTGIRSNVVVALQKLGIATELSPDEPFAELVEREKQWRKEVRALLLYTLRKHGGRISIMPKSPREEYPVTTTLYGQSDYPRIDISDLHLSEDGGQLLADGYEVDGCPREKRCGFSIHNEHLSDAFLFIRHIINHLYIWK